MSITKLFSKTSNSTPPTLTSSLIRQSLSMDVPAFSYVARSIEELGTMHLALTAIRSVNDSRLTREAQAEKYAKTFAAFKKKQATIRETVKTTLDKYQSKLREDAIAKSGLAEPYPQAEEVRRCLRELPKKERDAEISRAIEAGEAYIVGAVIGYPDLLTGSLSLTKPMITSLYLAKTAPELHSQIEAIGDALQHFSFADDTFEREAELMRDVVGEAKAEQDALAVAEADKLLAQALGSYVPPKEDGAE